jgi:hypothetical protein
VKIVSTLPRTRNDKIEIKISPTLFMLKDKVRYTLMRSATAIEVDAAAA